MVTTIKKGASKEEIKSVMEKIAVSSNAKKGFDAHKFCGTVNFNEDGLDIQKRMRDEWE